VPLSRLKFLFLGVFCLTGMVGCLLDAFVLGSKPVAEVIVWIVFTGIMAVGGRSPRSRCLFLWCGLRQSTRGRLGCTRTFAITAISWT
jgi:hypothetical protein